MKKIEIILVTKEKWMVSVMREKLLHGKGENSNFGNLKWCQTSSAWNRISRFYCNMAENCSLTPPFFKTKTSISVMCDRLQPTIISIPLILQKIPTLGSLYQMQHPPLSVRLLFQQLRPRVGHHSPWNQTFSGIVDTNETARPIRSARPTRPIRCT